MIFKLFNIVVVLIFITSCSQANFNGISEIKSTILKIRSPDSVENGAVTPISVYFSDYLDSNNKLILKVNGDKAFEFYVTKEMKISRVSTRVHMKESGKVEALLYKGTMLIDAIRSNDIIVEKTKSKSKSLNFTNKHHQRITGNKIQIIVANTMSDANYLEQLTIDTLEGSAIFKNTTVLSENPYFGLLVESIIGNVTIDKIKSNEYRNGVNKRNFNKSTQCASVVRDDIDIQNVFAKNAGSIYSIYNQALRKKPNLQGNIVLSIAIEPSGSVSKVKLISNELNDSNFEKKILDRIMRFKFCSKNVKKFTVTYPIEFIPK